LTIKRRLYMSNILMLIMPLIITILIAICSALVLLGLMGTHNFNSLRGENFSQEAMDQVNVLADSLPVQADMEFIRSSVDSFNKQYGSDSISLSVYKDNKLLYPFSTSLPGVLMESALSLPGKHFFVMDNVAVYKADSDGYSFMLGGTNYRSFGSEVYNNFRSDSIIYVVIIFILIIAIVLLTNRFLTRFVIRRILTPLEILSYGVHQIRDGNLNYRMNYMGKDEFRGICDDFNDMAVRLQDMVNARQKDDKNRRELIAGISHDLRTPLTSIKAYVEGLEKGVAETPQLQKHYMNTIKSKADDLEHIVSQLFLFSKLDVGDFPFRMEKLDIGVELSKFLNGVSDEYEQKGLFIELRENVQGVIINADQIQLRNVFTNILENSVKYGNKEHGMEQVTCREVDSNVNITLIDNGPGVPEDTLEKLFDIFYRGDKSRSNTNQGSGLGLAISAKIIERLRGSIKAGNAPEGGFSVIVTLPIIERG